MPDHELRKNKLDKISNVIKESLKFHERLTVANVRSSHKIYYSDSINENAILLINFSQYFNSVLGGDYVPIAFVKIIFQFDKKKFLIVSDNDARILRPDSFINIALNESINLASNLIDELFEL